MAVVSMSYLLEAGVHFGHQTKRWNPKMKEYIFIQLSNQKELLTQEYIAEENINKKFENAEIRGVINE